MNLDQMTEAFEDIATANNWQALHCPKNLASAIAVEAAELLTEFQWLTEQQSRELVSDTVAKIRIGGEVADVFLYLLALCRQLDLDLERVIADKIVTNRERFLSNSRVDG